jgi:HEAT repeat protein
MRLFAVAIVALTAVSVVFLVVLALRRVVLGARERRRVALESRLQPLALELVELGRLPPPLPARAATVFALLVGRYGRLTRGEAGEHVASYFERTGAVDEAVGRLRGRRSASRAEAAFALGDMGSARGVAPLVEALSDPAHDVRAAATRSLGRLGSVDAVEPVLSGLVGRRVPSAVVASAVLALGPAAVPPVRELLGSPDDAVRAMAVRLIGFLGDAHDARVVIPRLVDPSPDVRAQAALALGRLGAADAADAVRELLHDPEPSVRGSAATALGAIGDRDAVEALLAQARDDLFDPARSAAEALRQIAPERVAAEVANPGTWTARDAHLLEAADLAAL